MKRITITLLLLLSLTMAALAWLHYSKPGKSIVSLESPQSQVSYPVPSKTYLKLQQKARAVRAFAAQKKFNTSICFLVDMSLPSGQKRFFVYNLIKDTVQHTGLVTHGRCNQDWLQGRKYGNEPGCGCTSLGRYKIGYAYQGKFGLAFKLYGLDTTNDNAFQRALVLHAHGCVPETEISNDICQSDGCPTVSPAFLKALEPILKQSPNSVLLWIYK